MDSRCRLCAYRQHHEKRLGGDGESRTQEADNVCDVRRSYLYELQPGTCRLMQLGKRPELKHPACSSKG